MLRNIQKGKLLGLFILLPFSISAQTTYEVFDGGNIQAVINSATAGDTIKVGEGIYAEALSITKKIHLIGAGDRNNILISASGNAISLTAGSNGSSIVGFTIQSSLGVGIYVHHNQNSLNYLIMNNKIENCKVAGIQSGNYFNSANEFSYISIIRNKILNCHIGIDANYNPFVTSSENLIADNDSLGIDTFRGLSSADSIIDNGDGDGFGVELVEGGWISGATISGTGGNGIYINDADKVTIIGNKIVNSTMNGIQTFGNGTQSWKISNNIISGNQNHGIFFNYDIGGNQIFTQVSNNVVYNNSKSGIYFDEYYFGGTALNDLLINNNIIANNGISGIGRDLVANTWELTDIKLMYNNFYNNGTNYASGFVTGYQDISANPMFTNAANGDFSLSNGSSSVDAGQPSTGWLDLDLTRNDQGIYGGSDSFSQYYLNPGAARVMRLILSKRNVRQGDVITITADGLAR